MVVEFARMNMHQLLEETEKAVSISEVSFYMTPANIIVFLSVSRLVLVRCMRAMRS